MKTRIALEIDSDIFAQLVSSNDLALDQFTCLNPDTKQVVHDLYLSLLVKPQRLSKNETG